MSFDSVNLSFTTITEIAIAPDAFLSRFEGITAAEGGFNVVGMAASTNGAGEWFGFIATNGSGFSTNVQWASLEYPDADSTTANTVYGNYAIGVFVASGAGGEQPYVATIPEPSTVALLLLGAGALGLWKWRRA